MPAPNPAPGRLHSPDAGHLEPVEASAFRRPTGTRLQSRAWNPDDPHILTPKPFGWGFGLNFYWLMHPRRLVQDRRRPPLTG